MGKIKGYRYICIFLIMAAGFFQPFAYGNSLSASPYMPMPGTLLSVSRFFQPVYLRGASFSLKDIFTIDFVVDEGTGRYSSPDTAEQIERLFKYFLAAVTISEKDLWVNLDPREKERIIPGPLENTQIGEDLLKQDYLLKQLAASLTHPDTPQGKKYWNALRNLKFEISNFKSGGQGLLAKVWIVPDKIALIEGPGRVFIKSARLKVEIEKGQDARPAAAFKKNILPLIEKEVNEGKNFAPLRQIYYAMILAAWFKDQARATVLGDAYINKNKTAGADNQDPFAKAKTYKAYLESIRAGAYNFIQKENGGGRYILRKKYYSGGFRGDRLSTEMAAASHEDFKPDASSQIAPYLYGNGLDARGRFAVIKSRHIGADPDILARLKFGQVDIEALPDSKAKNILMTLRKAGVDAVVYGGSVRDILFSPQAGQSKPGDIDILLRVDRTSIPRLGRFMPVSDYERAANQVLEDTAKKLNISLRDLLNNNFRVGDDVVELLGVIDGNNVMNGRADRYNGIFDAPEISVNSVGIGIDGRVVDVRHALEDVTDSKLRIAGDWTMANPQTVLRSLKTILAMRRYGLQLDQESRDRLKGFFQEDNVAALAVRRYGVIKALLMEMMDQYRVLLAHGATDKQIQRLGVDYSRKIIDYEKSVQSFYAKHLQLDVEEMIERMLGVTVLGVYDGYADRKYTPPPAVTEEEASRLLHRYIFNASVPLNAKIDFSGDKAIVADDRMGIGVMVGNIYREASSPQEATEILREYGCEDFLKTVGLDLDDVEVQAREYFTANPVGGVKLNLSEADIERSSGIIDEASGEEVVIDWKNIQGLILRPGKITLFHRK